MPLRRRGEHQFQRPAQRAQQQADDHLVVAPRMPDQGRAPAPQFQEIAHAHARDAVGRIGTEPGRAHQFGELRRDHAVGRGDARIAPVQVRHDHLEIIGRNVFSAGTKSSSLRHFLYATLSIVASSPAPKPPLHRRPHSFAR